MIASQVIGAKSETAKSLNYVDAVLANSSCGKDSEAALIINWINYINQSYKSQGTHVSIDGITNILNKHKDCGCLESSVCHYCDPPLSAKLGLGDAI